jgi:hypothetical protein
MDIVKSSNLTPNDIIDAREVDGKIQVLLKDGKWYILDKDFIQLDAQGGPLMAYISGLMGKRGK